MSGDRLNDEDRAAFLRTLSAFYHSLVAARGDEAVLRQLSALLRLLKSGRLNLADDELRGTTTKRDSQSTFDEERIRSASLSQLQSIVEDENTSRKDLEFIAINRFSVPQGSMRRFSNKRMLVEKLLVLIGNERAHETIGEVARGELKVDRS